MRVQLKDESTSRELELSPVECALHLDSLLRANGGESTPRRWRRPPLGTTLAIAATTTAKITSCALVIDRASPVPPFYFTIIVIVPKGLKK